MRLQPKFSPALGLLISCMLVGGPTSAQSPILTLDTIHLNHAIDRIEELSEAIEYFPITYDPEIGEFGFRDSTVDIGFSFHSDVDTFQVVNIWHEVGYIRLGEGGDPRLILASAVWHYIMPEAHTSTAGVLRTDSSITVFWTGMRYQYLCDNVSDQMLRLSTELTRDGSIYLSARNYVSTECDTWIDGTGFFYDGFSMGPNTLVEYYNRDNPSYCGVSRLYSDSLVVECREFSHAWWYKPPRNFTLKISPAKSSSIGERPPEQTATTHLRRSGSSVWVEDMVGTPQRFSVITIHGQTLATDVVSFATDQDQQALLLIYTRVDGLPEVHKLFVGRH